MQNRKIHEFLTIDSENSIDLDDGLSAVYDPTTSTIVVTVFVAAPALFITPRQLEIAGKQLKTFFLPHGKVSLLPPALESRCSLTPEHVKSAFGVQFGVSAKQRAGSPIVKPRIFITRNAYNRGRYSFAEADALLREKRHPVLMLLSQAAKILSDYRTSRAGSQNEAQSLSKQILNELIVAANYVVALQAKDLKLPLIYQVHELKAKADQDVVDILQKLTEGSQSLADLPTIRKQINHQLRPARLSITPGSHYGLGLDCYCEFSNPLRSYTDLLNQWILNQAFQKQPLDRQFIAEEVKRINDKFGAGFDPEKERSRRFRERSLERQINKGLSALSPDQFSIVLESAIRLCQFDKVLAEARNRIGRMSDTDLYQILFKADHPNKQEFVPTDPSVALSVLNTAKLSRDKSSPIDFSIEIRGEKSVFNSRVIGCWESKQLTTREYCQGFSKLNAKGNAAILWLQGYASRSLIGASIAEELPDPEETCQGDSITQLNDYAQRRGIQVLYSFRWHDGYHLCKVNCGGHESEGVSFKKNTAKHQAARRLLLLLQSQEQKPHDFNQDRTA